MDNTSPKSSESGMNSKFKLLKKKIKNKFRISRTQQEGTKTIAQVVETLKRSDEVLAINNEDSEALKTEFKELKETLESILNQSQILSEVVKTVDSSCPDPFIEPEKFSVFFAHKSFASRSMSDEFFEEEEEEENVLVEPEDQPQIINNALVRLQNLRMEEQKSFQSERENYETRLSQLSLLQEEIEILRKENSEHEIQMEFLKSKTFQDTEHLDKDEINEMNSINEELKLKIEGLENELSQSSTKISEYESTIKSFEESELSLKDQIDQLKSQLEGTLLSMKSQQESTESQEEKDYKFRELSEENVRLKIELNEIQKEFIELKKQLVNYEKEVEKEAHDQAHDQARDQTRDLTSDQTRDQLKEKSSTTPNNDESAFKYVYLSNLVLKFMQFPEKRVALSNIILTTLQADQEYFQEAMK